MKERREATNLRRTENNVNKLGAQIFGGATLGLSPNMTPVKPVVAPVQPVEAEKTNIAEVQPEAVEEVKKESTANEETAVEKKKAPKKKKSGGFAAECIKQVAEVSNKKGPKGIQVYFEQDVLNRLDALIKEQRDNGYNISRSKIVNMILKNALGDGDDE